MANQVRVSVQPFTIEADTPRNGDLIVQCIPGCRLRGAIDATKGTVVNKQDPDNTPVVPQDQARYLGQFPKIPGQRLHVDPSSCEYRVTDPLYNDEEMCERIRRTMERVSPFRVGGKLNGVKPQEGKLDVHRMKTLCRELLGALGANEARLVEGPRPDPEDIDELPGKYLLNPGSRIPNQQPQFEEDFDEWQSQLARTGGG